MIELFGILFFNLLSFYFTETPINTTDADHFLHTATNTKKYDLSRVDAIIKKGLDEGAYPGCQVLISHKDTIIYQKCFGYTDTTKLYPVTDSTIYDLASVTKATGLLLPFMVGLEQELYALDDVIGQYIPEFKGTDKDSLTIRELLFHESGLPAIVNLHEQILDKDSYKPPVFKYKLEDTHPVQIDDNVFIPEGITYNKELFSTVPKPDFDKQVAKDLYIKNSFPERAILKKIARTKLKTRGKYLYSDLNFIILKEIFESRSGVKLDEFFKLYFADRLDAKTLGFKPYGKFPLSQIAPTENDLFWRNQQIHGFVHDESAALQGGVSGNAGLFSSGYDLMKLLHIYLHHGSFMGNYFVKPEICDTFTTIKSPNSRRGLGFDKPNVEDQKKSPCGDLATKYVFGHNGFTGTAFWIDPSEQTCFVFISNRVHPSRRNKKLMSLGIRNSIQNEIYRVIRKKN